MHLNTVGQKSALLSWTILSPSACGDGEFVPSSSVGDCGGGELAGGKDILTNREEFE